MKHFTGFWHFFRVTAGVMLLAWICPSLATATQPALEGVWISPLGWQLTLSVDQSHEWIFPDRDSSMDHDGNGDFKDDVVRLSGKFRRDGSILVLDSTECRLGGAALDCGSLFAGREEFLVWKLTDCELVLKDSQNRQQRYRRLDHQCEAP